MSEILRILLKIHWSELGLKDVDDDCDGSGISVAVEVLAENRFRVVEPTSLTPFGPYGGMLRMGTVIEAIPENDGSHRYVRSRGRPRVWTCIIPTQSFEATKAPAVSDRLDQLLDLHCGWEWCAGNLTVQGQLANGQESADSAITTLLKTLYELLNSKN